MAQRATRAPVSSASDMHPRSRRAWLNAPVYRQGLQAVLAAFLVTRLMMSAIIYLSSLLFASNPVITAPHAFPHNLLLDGLVHWDSLWYWRIVTQGYSLHATPTEGSVVFFPAYPVLIKAVMAVVHNPYLAGLLVSNAALFVALCYVYALARRELGEDAAARAVFYVAAAPAAVFFSAMYTESLFLVAVAATFYYARERQWVRAALAGALGAATRNTGVLLALVIALEGMSQAGVRFTPPHWKLAAVLAHVRGQTGLMLVNQRSLSAAAFVPVGLLLFMAYLGKTFGDPLAWAHNQSGWNNISTAHIAHITSTLRTDVASPTQLLSGQGLHSGYVVLDVLSIVGFAPIVLAVALKMRPAYGVYTLLTFVLPPIFGHGVISAIRFALMLLPCFILLAAWGRRGMVDRIILGVFLPVMTYLSITFSHAYPPF